MGNYSTKFGFAESRQKPELRQSEFHASFVVIENPNKGQPPKQAVYPSEGFLQVDIFSYTGSSTVQILIVKWLVLTNGCLYKSLARLNIAVTCSLHNHPH